MPTKSTSNGLTYEDIRAAVFEEYPSVGPSVFLPSTAIINEWALAFVKALPAESSGYVSQDVFDYLLNELDQKQESKRGLQYSALECLRKKFQNSLQYYCLDSVDGKKRAAYFYQALTPAYKEMLATGKVSLIDVYRLQQMLEEVDYHRKYSMSKEEAALRFSRVDFEESGLLNINFVHAVVEGLIQIDEAAILQNYGIVKLLITDNGMLAMRSQFVVFKDLLEYRCAYPQLERVLEDMLTNNGIKAQQNGYLSFEDVLEMDLLSFERKKTIDELGVLAIEDVVAGLEFEVGEYALIVYGSHLNDVIFQQHIIPFLMEHPEISDLYLRCKSVLFKNFVELSAIKTLRVISLSGCAIWSLKNVTPKKEDQQRHIERFEMNSVNLFSGKVMRALVACIHFKKLLMSEITLTPDDIAPLETIATLEAIAFSSIRMRGVASVGAFSGIPNLTELTLTQCGIETSDVRALLMIEKLKKLDISNNKIDDVGILLLAKNETLEWLDVSNNRGVLNGRVYGEFTVNQHLKYLAIRENFVRDNGAVMLANNKTLESLDLRGNDIERTGLAALVQSTTLRNLNYHNRKADFKIPDDIVAALMANPTLTCDLFTGQMSLLGEQIYTEQSPLKKYFNGKRYGGKVARNNLFPSLVRLSLFAVKMGTQTNKISCDEALSRFHERAPRFVV